MAVDDTQVKRINGDALARNASAAGCCGPVSAAFQELFSRRRAPGGSLDENLAAAEHYMYARQSVCSGYVSYTQMSAMVVGYETTKGIMRAVGLEKLMRTSPNPTAPASYGAMIWGLNGARDGQSDHDRCNAGVTPPAYNGDAYRYGSQYERAYGGK